MWNAPGWVVEKAGVVGAGAVVDGAPESLASKTVAVRGRGRGGCRCRCRGCGEGGVVVVEVLRASASEYCLIACLGVRSEIAGTAAAKADCRASLGTLALALRRLSAGTQKIGGWRMDVDQET